MPIINVLIFFVINSIIVSMIALRSYDISEKYNFLDYPSKGKIHSSPIPFIGGIIIYILLLGCFSLNFFVNLNINLYLFFYLSAFFILGFIDDRFDLNSNYKILSVILISLILIYFDESFLIHKIFFEISNNEFYFGHFKIPITIICILLLYIALNMSDGINCLLISFTIIALIIVNIFVLKRDLGFMDISLLSSLGTLLYFNYRNKIFLGNTGANLLSAYFIYILINKNYHDYIDVFEVISVFFIIGLDMVRLIFTRLFNKSNPFKRDLNHLHHLLYKKFDLKITIVIYLIISFLPLILHYLTNTTLVFYMPFQILIYSIIIYKLK